MDDLPPMVILDKLPSEKSPPQIGHGVVGELDFGEPRWSVKKQILTHRIHGTGIFTYMNG